MTELVFPVDVPDPGFHGGDGPQVARALGMDLEEMLDLSHSMNPFAPDVAYFIEQHPLAVGHYPDSTEATHALATALGVAPGRVLLTNGGSEAIALVARELGGQVRSEPEFALHPRDGEGPVWRSDPHSPSGVLATSSETADVWDEAFYPLATGKWTAERPGVVVGSLTKVFGCPGLRMGYLIADDVDRFARHQIQWSVSSVALEILPDLLELADVERSARAIAEARTKLVESLTRRGLEVQVGDAPWVLVHARGLREQLAPNGVLVRDCANFALSGVARIAVPHPVDLARLESALDWAGYAGLGTETKSG